MAWTETPESSAIRGVDYDEHRQVLTIEFNSGTRYNYFDVPKASYDGLERAPSKGQYLARAIKGRFRYARV